MTVTTKLRSYALAIAMAAGALAACGSDAQADIALENPYALETVAGQGSTAAYMTIVNDGDGDDRLIGVSVPAPMKASLHESVDDNGIMRMRMRDSIPVAAGARVELRPMGPHVMITGLDSPLGAGARLPISLRFERSGERVVDAEVRNPSAGAPGDDR